MNTQLTPDFESPPVVETVLGIGFRPLPQWSVPHFGLYWNEIRTAYPTVSVQQRIDPVVEKFGSGPKAPNPEVVLEFPADPNSVRCWFIDKSERRLIQIQNDRFILNWRRMEDADQYPRYPTLRRDLEEQWRRFCDFLRDNDLGTPSVNQCEVTYVNHINRGDGWQTFHDLPSVFPYWSGRHSGKFLPEPESVSFNVRYLMPDNLGRLHVVLQHALRRDAKETLQLNLTARGAPKSSNVTDVFSWLDLGREWVVRGFADFTSQAMHKTWGRKQ